MDYLILQLIVSFAQETLIHQEEITHAYRAWLKAVLHALQMEIYA